MDSSHIALPDQTVPAPVQGRADRRQFLRTVGRAGLAALLAPGLLPMRLDRAQGAQQPLIQPPELRSQNGELRVTLTAAPASMQLGDIEFSGFLYNNDYVPPLLRVRLGDVLRVRLQNNMPEGFSNLHFHGLSVSPRGRSDNVFIHVAPGREFEYEVMIPKAGRQARVFSGTTRMAMGLSRSRYWADYQGRLLSRDRRRCFRS